MKLAAVQHIRCGSWEDRLYVWIPDEMTEEELDDLVDDAMRAYLEADIAGKEAAPEDPGYTPPYALYPDKLVKDVQNEYNRQKLLYTEWYQKHETAKKPFDWHLYRLSGGKIRHLFDMGDDNGMIEVFVDWGHRHGTTIKTTETTKI